MNPHKVMKHYKAIKRLTQKVITMNPVVKAIAPLSIHQSKQTDNTLLMIAQVSYIMNGNQQEKRRLISATLG
jgi:hypothetical protein